MNNILLITSSPRGAESLSSRYASQVAHGILKKTGGRLTVRDLVAQPLPHITAAYLQGRITAPEARTAEQIEALKVAEALVAELRAADVIVLGSGMINFAPSSQLKAWIDHITWPGVTFSYGATGPQGLLSNKKVYLVTAAGGVFSEGMYAPFDFQTSYLQHILGFIGLGDVELIRIEGTVLGQDAVQAATSKADAMVQSILA